jgi:drug/metabolite transporter (DMT)-like permease
MMLSGTLVVLMILAGTGGQLALSRGMKQVGEVGGLSFAGLARTFAAAVRQPWVYAGVFLDAVAFFAMLALFTREDLSLVVPVTAFTYVTGTFGARFLLGEHVCWRRWTGTLLVATGVALTILERVSH